MLRILSNLPPALQKLYNKAVDSYYYLLDDPELSDYDRKVLEINYNHILNDFDDGDSQALASSIGNFEYRVRDVEYEVQERRNQQVRQDMVHMENGNPWFRSSQLDQFEGRGLNLKKVLGKHNLKPIVTGVEELFDPKLKRARQQRVVDKAVASERELHAQEKASMQASFKDELERELDRQVEEDAKEYMQNAQELADGHKQLRDQMQAMAREHAQQLANSEDKGRQAEAALRAQMEEMAKDHANALDSVKWDTGAERANSSKGFGAFEPEIDPSHLEEIRAMMKENAAGAYDPLDDSVPNPENPVNPMHGGGFISNYNYYCRKRHM